MTSLKLKVGLTLRTGCCPGPRSDCGVVYLSVTDTKLALVLMIRSSLYIVVLKKNNKKKRKLEIETKTKVCYG